MITLCEIEEARERIKDQIYFSPFPYSETVSRMTGSRVFFKLENLQMTGSFKERGALNRLLTLAPEKTQRGVIAASAGNHGMAVVFHSRRLNISATIVMLITAPLIKVTRVRQYGAETFLHGNDYDAADYRERPHSRRAIESNLCCDLGPSRQFGAAFTAGRRIRRQYFAD